MVRFDPQNPFQALLSLLEILTSFGSADFGLLQIDRGQLMKAMCVCRESVARFFQLIDGRICSLQYVVQKPRVGRSYNSFDLLQLGRDLENKRVILPNRPFEIPLCLLWPCTLLQYLSPMGCETCTRKFRGQ